MAEKFAIYAGVPLSIVLQGHEHQRSARVNQVAAEYLQLIADLCPALTQAEWLATADALNSTAIDDDATLKYIWAAVADTEGLAEKWEIDPEKLVARLRKLTQPELMALREIIRRWWDLAGGYDTKQALHLAGAKIGD